jgi:hypothetical protein
MYRGRIQLGQEVKLGFLAKDANGNNALPDTTPTFRIYNSSGTMILNGLVPIEDRFGYTGIFEYQQFIDSRFAAGLYFIVFKCTVSSIARTEVDHFEVLAGGDRHGAVVAMEYYVRPQASFVVQNTLSGALINGRNPSL